MPADSAKIAATGLAVMSAAEVPNFLAGALPSGMTIRRFAAKAEDRRTLRIAEVFGSSLALAVGIGASLTGGTPLPLLASGLMLTAMIIYYEWNIRNPHPDARTIDDQPGVKNFSTLGA